jgi:hypothetical protein
MYALAHTSAGVREFRVRGSEWGVGVIESWSVKCDEDHS